MTTPSTAVAASSRFSHSDTDAAWASRSPEEQHYGAENSTEHDGAQQSAAIDSVAAIGKPEPAPAHRGRRYGDGSTQIEQSG